MSNERIAIPSQTPGGLEVNRSGHFGRCDVFTIIDLEAGSVKNISVLKNVDHSEGGCLVPVQLLADQGVTSIIVGGMGLRPLQGFKSVGINVLVGKGEKVQESLDAYLNNELSKMSEDNVCNGH